MKTSINVASEQNYVDSVYLVLAKLFSLENLASFFLTYNLTCKTSLLKKLTCLKKINMSFD